MNEMSNSLGTSTSSSVSFSDTSVAKVDSSGERKIRMRRAIVAAIADVHTKRCPLTLAGDGTFMSRTWIPLRSRIGRSPKSSVQKPPAALGREAQGSIGRIEVQASSEGTSSSPSSCTFLPKTPSSKSHWMMKWQRLSRPLRCRPSPLRPARCSQERISSTPTSLPLSHCC